MLLRTYRMIHKLKLERRMKTNTKIWSDGYFQLMLKILVHFTLSLLFFAAMIGTAFSMLIRMELTAPGAQYLNNSHQLYNSIVTAHAFIMIFFMVNAFLINTFASRFYVIISTCKPHFNIVHHRNISWAAKRTWNKNDPKSNYTTYVIENPFHNLKKSQKLVKVNLVYIFLLQKIIIAM